MITNAYTWLRPRAAKAGSVDILSPFVSTIGVNWLLTHKNLRIRLIFRWPSGGVDNPTTDMYSALGLLAGAPNVSVRLLQGLHAKAYLFAKAGLITSANLTGPGLNLAGGQHNVEWGVQVSGKDLKTARVEFNKLWKASLPLDWKVHGPQLRAAVVMPPPVAPPVGMTVMNSLVVPYLVAKGLIEQPLVPESGNVREFMLRRPRKKKARVRIQLSVPNQPGPSYVYSINKRWLTEMWAAPDFFGQLLVPTTPGGKQIAPAPTVLVSRSIFGGPKAERNARILQDDGHEATLSIEPVDGTWQLRFAGWRGAIPTRHLPKGQVVVLSR